MAIIERIKNGENIKNFTVEELKILTDEIRTFLIEKVSKTGGHLASNLGVVEITVALHYVYDFPQDKIIWDVGHQSYVHKILTGRMDGFDSLRKFGGLSGFPKTSESEYDCFNTGHSSTSVSAALGMAKARDLKNESNEMIAFIGDGSLGGGLAYEAINDAGNSNTKMLIVLNDNEMSIAKNVGGMSLHLSSLRTSGRYFRLKHKILTFLKKKDQKALINFIRNFKNSIKKALLKNTVFEDLGLTYFGPFDGHNLEQLIKILRRIKNMDEPVIMHIRTSKGKGYAPAENKPSDYHGVSSFDHKKGIEISEKKDYSAVFGEKLINIAKENEKVVAITAAMPDGTGLKQFSVEYPKRFFDVGIAEQHAVTSAAGMAANGIVPVVAVYSTFFQRAYDSILHDVCLQKLHVVFCADRAGIVGADGDTHQGIYDIAFTRPMPCMEILAPADYKALEGMLDYAVNGCEHPVFIRYPRGCEERKVYSDYSYIPGKANVLTEGERVVVFACGNMVAKALESAEQLKNEGIFITVVDLQCISALDEEVIGKYSSEAELVITAEDGILKGGTGEAVGSFLLKKGFKGKLCCIGYKNGIIEQGSQNELMRIFDVDSRGITETVKNFFSENNI